jgi:hypothetical protein
MLNITIRRLSTAIVALLFATTASIALADDVTDSVNEALQLYKDGKFSEAVNSLNYASQLIQQKKGASLEAVLPAALAGWTAEEATSQAAGASMFGGGVTAERRYTKDSSSVKVQIVTDSPVLQAVMMMMSNPMFATSDGGKMETIGGQKAIVKMDAANKSGQIQIVVANRFLVTLEGEEVTKDDMSAYAKAIDYTKLATLP